MLARSLAALSSDHRHRALQGLKLDTDLAEMRAAKSMPWDDNRTALYRTIFPQMTGCLPEEEGAQLRFQFEEGLARLEAA